jgi:hypothetical protein
VDDIDLRICPVYAPAMSAITKDSQLSPTTKNCCLPKHPPKVSLGPPAVKKAADEKVHRAHYSPPWANTSIIGIAGSSGSGKTSLAQAIIRELNLPWVVILSMDCFYKVLTPEQSAAAFRNEYDFDSPDAVDFDILVQKLRDIKMGYGHPSQCIPAAANPLQARRPKFQSTLSANMLERTTPRPSTRLTC